MSERQAVHDTKIIPLQEEWKKLGLALGSWVPELEHWGTRRVWRSQCVPKKFTNTQMASGSAQTRCFFLVMKLGSGDQETFVVGKGCTTAELH